MVPAVDEVQEGLGAERLSPPKRNALAAWRFEPCSTFNDKSNHGEWITQSWQRHEMESLTLALQRELSSPSSTRNYNNNEKKMMLQLSDSSMASSGAGFNASLIPPPAASSSRNLDAVGSPVTSSEADTTPTIFHFVAPDGSNGTVGLGNQLSSNGSRASPVVVGNKSHPLSTINGGKVSKTRRSRASSKSPVTFLTADPENFKAMVQQVTGIPWNPTATTARLWSPSGGIRVPLPRRDFSSASARKNIKGLPTLDTSSVRIDMSQDRLLGPQGRHVLNSYNSLQISNSIHDPLIKSDVPFRTGDLLTENLRSSCVQPWMEIMGGSLPFTMSNLDVDGWMERSDGLNANHSQRQQ